MVYRNSCVASSIPTSFLLFADVISWMKSQIDCFFAFSKVTLWVFIITQIVQLFHGTIRCVLKRAKILLQWVTGSIYFHLPIFWFCLMETQEDSQEVGCGVSWCRIVCRCPISYRYLGKLVFNDYSYWRIMLMAVRIVHGQIVISLTLCDCGSSFLTESLKVITVCMSSSPVCPSLCEESWRDGEALQ